MLWRIIAILVGIPAVALLTALVSQPGNGDIIEAKITAPVETPSPIDTKTTCERPKQQTQAGHVIDSFDRFTHKGYLIQTRYTPAKLDAPRESASKPAKASYVVVSKKGRVLRKFDSPVDHYIEAGFFSLLGTRSDQLIISQGRFKTGVQWVADFSKGFQIIFDGVRFDVGREAHDMIISDLDRDGSHEIIVPITAFYGFQSWRLTTGETPLPKIIFRYDPIQREYLPANLFFKKCILKDTEAAEKSAREIEKEQSLGRLMSIVLDYVFVGEEQRGWKFFEDMCTLPDKAGIKSDMQKVLKAHPVYQYVQRSLRHE